MIAYFYINKNDAENAAECGLKLSVYGKEIYADKLTSDKIIRALISPKDDLASYNNDNLSCLKLDIPKGKLLVAEETYLDTGNSEWFNESIIHAEEYIFGTYRKPCYLITFTVNSDYIGVLDKDRDVPVLYDDSEELYIHKMRTRFEDGDENFYDKAMYGYLKVLQQNWKATIEWQSDDYTIFRTGDKKYIIRNPVNEK